MQTQTHLLSNSPGICANCGNHSDNHHWLDFRCPNDKEIEVLTEIVPEWLDTTFENIDYRRLRDAAPELLECLEEVLEIFQPDCKDKFWWPEGLSKLIDKADKVINKATV